MNSNQLAANPSSLHPELALNSLQTQPEFFPVMHLMVPPLNSLSPSLCNSPCKQKPLHFPASLMKLLAELFLKIKSLFWRQRECGKEWEARYLFLLTGETGHCGISLVKMVSNLPHVKKMFPKFTKFFCRTIKWNIYLIFYKTISFPCYPEAYIPVYVIQMCISTQFGFFVYCQDTQCQVFEGRRIWFMILWACV